MYGFRCWFFILWCRYERLQKTPSENRIWQNSLLLTIFCVIFYHLKCIFHIKHRKALCMQKLDYHINSLFLTTTIIYILSLYVWYLQEFTLSTLVSNKNFSNFSLSKNHSFDSFWNKNTKYSIKCFTFLLIAVQQDK